MTTDQHGRQILEIINWAGEGYTLPKSRHDIQAGDTLECRPAPINDSPVTRHRPVSLVVTAVHPFNLQSDEGVNLDGVFIEGHSAGSSTDDPAQLEPYVGIATGDDSSFMKLYEGGLDEV